MKIGYVYWKNLSMKQRRIKGLMWLKSDRANNTSLPTL